MRLRIGIDLMGGDNPPEFLFSAILESAKKLSSSQSLLVLASKDIVEKISYFLSSTLSTEICARISFLECEDIISMTDNPLSAVRQKKKSSLVVGMGLLKRKKIDAFVSCGNTGAIITAAAIFLNLLPGITHPALLANLPTEKGTVAVLDVGGSVLKKAQQLVRFAFLGAAFQKTVQGIEKPVIGLLNIGMEVGKGTLEIRQAYEFLNTYSREPIGSATVPSMIFAGNIEARDLYKGSIDVLVTDGFTGNVLLKTAEGVASFIFNALQEKVNLETVVTNSFENAFNGLKKQFDYAGYPGAIVCGIDNVVIKVHGNATADSLGPSIFSAIEYVEKQVISHMKDSCEF